MNLTLATPISASKTINSSVPAYNSLNPLLLRVLTQNCYGLPINLKNRRFLEIAGSIRNLQPDLIFLQEVLFKNDERIFRIDGYQRAFIPGPIFLSGGLLVLAKTQIGKISFHTFKEQGRILDMQMSDRLLGKGWLEVELPHWGITAVNTHLVSVYEQTTGHPDGHQGRQVEQLLDRLDILKSVILGGDLNFPVSSPYYNRMCSWGSDISHSEDITFPQEGSKIDYLFMKGLSHLVEYSDSIRYQPLIAGKTHIPVSDHYGIMSVLAHPSISPKFQQKVPILTN